MDFFKRLSSIYLLNKTSTKSSIPQSSNKEEVDLHSAPISFAYVFPCSSVTWAFLYKSALFAAIPTIILSEFISLIIFNHLFKSSKEFLSSIAYTNKAIFASFINIFVKLLYFSYPAVSHNFIS